MSTDRIRDLNDKFRCTLTGGRLMLTAGIDPLPDDVKARIIEAVRQFDAFTADNDPYGEHDFGSLAIDGHKVFFKIDLFRPQHDLRLRRSG